MTSARSATSALMIWLGVPAGVMSVGFGGRVGAGHGTCTGIGTLTICVWIVGTWAAQPASKAKQIGVNFQVNESGLESFVFTVATPR